jgi:hypothetical protein
MPRLLRVQGRGFGGHSLRLFKRFHPRQGGKAVTGKGFRHQTVKRHLLNDHRVLGSVISTAGYLGINSRRHQSGSANLPHGRPIIPLDHRSIF